MVTNRLYRFGHINKVGLNFFAGLLCLIGVILSELITDHNHNKKICPSDHKQ